THYCELPQAIPVFAPFLSYIIGASWMQEAKMSAHVTTLGDFGDLAAECARWLPGHMQRLFAEQRCSHGVRPPACGRRGKESLAVMSSSAARASARSRCSVKSRTHTRNSSVSVLRSSMRSRSRVISARYALMRSSVLASVRGGYTRCSSAGSMCEGNGRLCGGRRGAWAVPHPAERGSPPPPPPQRIGALSTVLWLGDR